MVPRKGIRSDQNNCIFYECSLMPTVQVVRSQSIELKVLVKDVKSGFTLWVPESMTLWPTPGCSYYRGEAELDPRSLYWDQPRVAWGWNGDIPAEKKPRCSWYRDWTQVFRIEADSLPSEAPGKPKNTGVGSPSLVQGIFPTQELNWGLLYCRRILHQLSWDCTYRR